MKFIKFINEWFKTFPKRVFDTFLRFPASILCAAVLFVISDLQEHMDIFDDKMFFKLIFTLAIGLVLFAAGELILEAYGSKRPFKRIIAGIITYVLLQGYYFVAEGGSGRGAAQFAMIAVGVCLFAIVALNIKNGEDFEKNVARIIVRIASSAFFALVLFGGLCAVVGSIDILLVNMDYKWYTEMAQICFIIFFPVMFFMGLPKKADDGIYPKPLMALLSYVIVPVIMIFTVVLYIYYIKLVVTRSLPISEVGGVSLAFLAACIPTLILVTPFKNKLSVYLRNVIPYVLIPVILVLFLAAGRQISMYGITVTRYLVVIGGIASLISVLLIKVKEGSKQRIACYVVAAACVISAFGPQSAYNLTAYSQNKRFEGYLIKNNMLKDGVIVPNSDVSSEDKKEIIGITNYFRNNDLGYPKYFPKDSNDYEGIFGFNVDIYRPKYKYYRTEGHVIDITDYDYLCEKDIMRQSLTVGTKNIEISEMTESGITIRINGDIVCDISKQEIANQIYDKIDIESEVQSSDNLSYIYENEYIKLKFLFSEISFNTESKSNLYQYGTYKALLKVK